MSTRSTVALLSLDGTVTHAYCHSDGYLSYNGVLLYEHYRDVNKVKQHLSFGSASSLAENVSPPHGVEHSFDYNKRAPNVTTFYGRDRGETEQEATVHKNLDDYKTNGDFQEYDYIFKEKNSTWYLYHPNTQKFQKLKTALKKEVKNSPKIQDVLERVEVIENIVKEKAELDKATPKKTTVKKEVKI